MSRWPKTRIHFLLLVLLFVIVANEFLSGHSLLTFGDLFLIVSASVELVEHVEENRILTHSQPKPYHRVARLQEVQKYSIDSAAQKLYKLQLSYVLLPPQVLLHGRTERGQSVVRVHDHVDDGVEEDEQHDDRYERVQFEREPA